MWKFIFLFTFVISIATSPIAQQSTPDFRNPNLLLQKRVDDLLKNLTLKEKISMLGFCSPAVERLDIPAYNWWNKGLHGVARAGEATVFPQAIGMATSFNNDLRYQVANAITTGISFEINISNDGDFDAYDVPDVYIKYPELPRMPI